MKNTCNNAEGSQNPENSPRWLCGKKPNGKSEFMRKSNLLLAIPIFLVPHVCFAMVQVGFFTSLTTPQSAVYGSTITFSGILCGANCSDTISTCSPDTSHPAPIGASVSITIGNSTLSAPVYDNSGDFTVEYTVTNLYPSVTPYPISYGNNWFYTLNGQTNQGYAPFLPTLTVTPLPVILIGTRIYDGTATASATVLTVSNAVPGDHVYVSGTATLSDAGVGVESIKSLSGLTLAGASATNYTLSGGSGAVMITIPPSITPLRVSQQQTTVGPRDDIDAPIVPVADSALLTMQNGSINTSLGLGVVADEVTPVLFQIAGASGSYFITMSNTAVGYASISTNLYVLNGAAWVQSTNFTIAGASGSGNGFAYLRGLNWTNFNGLSISNDVPLTINLNMYVPGGVNTVIPILLPLPYPPFFTLIWVTNPPPSTVVASTTFRIRPPPVVLVHGYNTDARTWTSSFLGVITNVRPADFVYTVSYETNNGNMGNTTNPLALLALSLDYDLQTQVEQTLTNWAYTRYDLVGHSQGGVLSRMLCQIMPDGNSAFAMGNLGPVVSWHNFYRGRFRRVITIGSPHNGSRLLHYILDLKKSYNPIHLLIPVFLNSIAQVKFDPFKDQIAYINNPSLPVDSRIKFVCIQTTINSGNPPSNFFLPTIPLPVDIDCYGALGLESPAGVTVLPEGSDGVVDFESQGGGFGTPTDYISSSDISHADVTSAFGTFQLFHVPPGQSQTTYPLIATNVMALLAGSNALFGSFQLPMKLTQAQQSAIDSAVPLVILTDLIFAGASHLIVSSNYNYTINYPKGTPTGNTITWYVQVFGPNGISSDGVSLLVSSNNTSQATVTVTNGVQGTVVLYAAYSATNGTFVVANPVVVVSNPVGTTLNGIQLQPSSATLSLGDSLSVDVWGVYTNGATSQLYLTAGQANYVSSNTNVATVDAYGTVTMNSFGTATITASYNGFTAQSTLSTVTPTITRFSGIITTNKTFNLSFMGTPGTTNIIQSSTNLIQWSPLVTLNNSNGFIQFQETISANMPEKYYRVIIP